MQENAEMHKRNLTENSHFCTITRTDIRWIKANSRQTDTQIDKETDNETDRN